MPETSEEKLKKMTAADVPPLLTDPEIGDLLAEACIEDATGLAPGEAFWEPTYDLNSAASAGWLIKAGRASGLVEVDPPESGIVTAKVFDNCRMMARLYKAKCRTSVSIRPPLA